MATVQAGGRLERQDFTVSIEPPAVAPCCQYNAEGHWVVPPFSPSGALDFIEAQLERLLVKLQGLTNRGVSIGWFFSGWL